MKPDARLELGDSLLLKKNLWYYIEYIKAEELSCLDVIAYKLTAAFAHSLFTKQLKAGDWFSKNVFPDAEFLPQANIPLEAGWHWDVESNVLNTALLGEKGYYDRNEVVSPCYSQPAWFFSVIVTLLSLLNALWWHLAKENGEPWTRPLTLDNYQSRSTLCLA